MRFLENLEATNNGHETLENPKKCTKLSSTIDQLVSRIKTVCCSVIGGDLIFCWHYIEKLVKCLGVPLSTSLKRKGKKRRSIQKTLHIPVFSVSIPSRNYVSNWNK